MMRWNRFDFILLISFDFLPCGNTVKSQNNFSNDGGIFHDRLVETAAAVFVGTTRMGQKRHLVFRIGSHQLVAMGTGIMPNRDADQGNARVLLHALSATALAENSARLAWQ